jgi:hypothetical protein
MGTPRELVRRNIFGALPSIDREYSIRVAM